MGQRRKMNNKKVLLVVFLLLSAIAAPAAQAASPGQPPPGFYEGAKVEGKFATYGRWNPQSEAMHVWLCGQGTIEAGNGGWWYEWKYLPDGTWDARVRVRFQCWYRLGTSVGWFRADELWVVP